MDTLLDFAIGLGAMLAAAYCLLLSRRLRALTRLDSDLGAAIAVMSQQVDALTRALALASQSGSQAEASLALTIARAETASRNLELLLAANRAPQAYSGSGSSPAAADNAAPNDNFAPFSRAPTRTRVLRTRDADPGERT